MMVSTVGVAAAAWAAMPEGRTTSEVIMETQGKRVRENLMILTFFAESQVPNGGKDQYHGWAVYLSNY